MGEVIADAIGRDLNEVGVLLAKVSPANAIHPQSVSRRFAVVTSLVITPVLFAGIGERVEITHKSSSRVTYAHGSLRAARFLADKRLVSTICTTC